MQAVEKVIVNWMQQIPALLNVTPLVLTAKLKADALTKKDEASTKKATTTTSTSTTTTATTTRTDVKVPQQNHDKILAENGTKIARLIYVDTTRKYPSCPITLEEFKIPILLNCLHTFVCLYIYVF